jgi:hypothetical protein
MAGASVSTVGEPAALVDRYLRAIDRPNGVSPDLAALEAEFVRVAKQFSEQHHISYGAWRDIGVPAEVLRRADIHPSH